MTWVLGTVHTLETNGLETGWVASEPHSASASASSGYWCAAITGLFAWLLGIGTQVCMHFTY